MKQCTSLLQTAAVGIFLSTFSTGCSILPGSSSNLTAFSDHHPAAADDFSAETGGNDSGWQTVSYRTTECGDTSTCNPSCQIERGRPNRFADGVGWVTGIPQKIVLWDRRAENHDISRHTEDTMRRYLAENNLNDVKVRLNQYAPGGEWRRLRDNPHVTPGWKYTVGALSVLGYTVLPGRLLGGDGYNPFTNTINLYSDIPSVAIHEGAYARDNADHRYRGTYGVLQGIGGINIWHETMATQKALNYAQFADSPGLRSEANRILHPLYGARVGESIGGILPQGEPLFSLTGALIGHGVGRTKNRKMSKNSEPAMVAESGTRPARSK